MNTVFLKIPIYIWLPPVFATVILLACKFLFGKRHRYEPNYLSSGIGVIGSSKKHSLVHRWNPKIKIVSGIVFSFFSVSLSTVFPLLIALIWTVLFSGLARIPLNLFIRRLKPVIALFVALVIFLPLTAPPSTTSRVIILEPFSNWPISCEALLKAVIIGLKAVTVVATTTLILETSSYTVTISALQRMGFPASLSQMLLLTYRYIFVLVDEAERMHRSMKLRGFTPGTNLETLKVTAHFIGTLFIRSLERVQRITEAMKLRGYRGRFPDFYRFEIKPIDWILGLVWFCVSVGIYVAQKLLITE